MNPINLSKDQFNMIVEICSKLFPEYEIVEYNEQFDDLTDGLIRFRIGTLYKSVTFHWFEFCMTHLLNKLCDQWEMSYYNTDGYFGLKHPVDYLYEKFKQLK